jgi:hypothetical protein
VGAAVADAAFADRRRFGRFLFVVIHSKG